MTTQPAAIIPRLSTNNNPESGATVIVRCPCRAELRRSQTRLWAHCPDCGHSIKMETLKHS